jgi:NinG protein
MKTYTKPTVKEPSMSVLISELDKLVSDFVRMSAADERGTVQCVSCDARMYWKDADCAHYVNRSNMATRYYLPNLAPACQDCNRLDPINHLVVWKLKMGEERSSELILKGRSLEKFTRGELLVMIENYKLSNRVIQRRF